MNGYFKEDGRVHVTDDTVDQVIRRKIKEYESKVKEDPFYVIDLNDVVAKYKRWRRELPRVEPFFAIKCNHDPMVMATLASLGGGFDCANKGEMERAMALNMPPEMLAFANPCKQISHLHYAKERGIAMMTFDNADELKKVKEHYPEAKLILRIKPEETPDVSDRLSLNLKFGVTPKNTRRLLTIAKELDLNVIGVSFHVGTAEYPPSFFVGCLQDAKDTFDIGKELGFNFKLLDIGGGFCGHSDAKYTFEEATASIRPALDELFPPSTGVRIIAEPGRYMVDSAFTLTVNVLAKRVLYDNEVDTGVQSDKEIPRRLYFVSCGVFHSFLGRTRTFATRMRDFDVYNPEDFEGKPRYPCTIWGPSMAPGDYIVNGEKSLPDLEIGDWLVFPDMGDYSIAQFSHFGSIGFPEHVYIIRDGALKES